MTRTPLPKGCKARILPDTGHGEHYDCGRCNRTWGTATTPTACALDSSQQPSPGPWDVLENEGGEKLCVVSRPLALANAGKRCVVSRIDNRVSLRPTDAEDRANARLIAAAPELLAALEAALTPLIRLGDFIGNDDKGGASGLGPFDRCAIISAVRSAIAKAKEG
jgi:hypothetical protein